MKQPKTIPALRRRGTRLGRNQRPTKKKKNVRGIRQFYLPNLRGQVLEHRFFGSTFGTGSNPYSCPQSMGQDPLFPNVLAERHYSIRETLFDSVHAKSFSDSLANSFSSSTLAILAWGNRCRHATVGNTFN